MAPIDPQRFSELTNALQSALLLAQRRTDAARAETVEAAALFAAVERAAHAAHALRHGPDQEEK